MQSSCRICCRDKKRINYAKDPARARIKRMEYYNANKARCSDIGKRSRLRNLEARTEGNRKWYEQAKQSEVFQSRSASYRAARTTEKREYDRDYRETNRNELSEKKAAWRAEHVDLVRAIRSSYKARRRMKEAGGDSPATIAAWLALQEKICEWCGVDCADDFHIDHRYPLARGGPHVVQNMGVACPTCNIRKNAKDPDVFRREVERHRCDLAMVKQ